MSDREPTILGRPISTHYSISGEGTGSNPVDIDWETLLAPGDIAVSRPGHRRLLEEVGEADNPRVKFIGDAAKAGDSDER